MMKTFVCKLFDTDTFNVEGAEIVNLNDNKQYNYTFWNLSKNLYRILYELKKEALDLFYLSLMVFYADRSVLRSLQPDGWTRHIEVYMPVLNVGKWNANSDLLKRMLDFLTGDDWKFHFRDRICITADEDKYKRGKYHFRRSTQKIDTDVFCMLSGGLDSFIGAIDLLSSNVNPIFVGNYNGGKGVSVYQNRVIDSLQKHFKIAPERFYQFYAAPKSGKEDTTRSPYCFSLMPYYWHRV